MKTRLLLGLLALGLLPSCRIYHRTFGRQKLSPITVRSPRGGYPYRAASPLLWEISNTRVELSFNFEEKIAEGIETVQLHPYAVPQDSLVLDAKSTDVLSVTSGRTPVPFELRGEQLHIRFSKAVEPGDDISLRITYTAQPYRKLSGGSRAITDDRGLYFINTDHRVPGKPVQIWTQGESEANSHWFPTIDKPNQRSRFEIVLNVPDSMQTLSNGAMTSSKRNGRMRTDTWVMDQPIQVYAAMFAIGKFSVVKDNPAMGREIAYYVEKDYAPYAKSMFRNTPEMVQYFSEFTGVPFPWNKYSQVVVRDYVSGAMENTSASLFGEFMNQNDREIADESHEDVVSHELFHQWFGDYVTFESWSNLTVSESFATFGEYIWRQHKYGSYSADKLRVGDLARYLLGAQQSDPPLVRFQYADREDMFDLVSYQKGGAILTYLRQLIGPAAFGKAMNLYLTDNALKSAEATQWRLAVEEATGEDWNWFFNQWYLRGGHPTLKVNYGYVDEAQKLVVTINQEVANNGSMYRLPLKGLVLYGNEQEPFEYVVNGKEKILRIPYKNGIRPVFVPDAEHVLPGLIAEEKAPASWLEEFRHADNYISKRRALNFAMTRLDADASVSILVGGLEDEHAEVRLYTIQQLQKPKNPEQTAYFIRQITRMAETDGDHQVQAAAYDYLAYQKAGNSRDAMLAGVKSNSYLAAGAALHALYVIDDHSGYELARQAYYNDPRGRLQSEVWQILGKSGDDRDLLLFLEKADQQSGTAKYAYVAGLNELLRRLRDDDSYERGIQVLTNITQNESDRNARAAIGGYVFRQAAENKAKARHSAVAERRLAIARRFAQQITERETDPQTKQSFETQLNKIFESSRRRGTNENNSRTFNY